MSILDIPHGIHRDISPSTYHGRHLGLVSKSALDLVNRSPAHYKAWIDGAEIDEESEALAFGSAFHCAILEPDRFDIDYVVEPEFGDCRNKANKAARDDWRSHNAVRTCIAQDERDRIQGMREAVLSHPLAGKIIRDGEAEVTLRWKDAETGLECKSRADYYVKSRRMVADVKTTIDARPDAFKRSIAKYRYAVQDALYRAAFAAVDEPIEHFVFVAVEKTKPYAVSTFSLNLEGISLGYNRARDDIRRMAECMNTGVWPGYEIGIHTIDVPPWAA